MSYTQNWDGVVAPAKPSDWTFNANWLTDSSVFRSAPNALVYNSANTLGLAYYNTPDTSGGNVYVEAWFNASALTDTNDEAFVFARSNSTPTTSGNYYIAGIQIGTGDSPHGLVLQKRISGTTTTLAHVDPTGDEFASGVWYRVRMSFLGTAISVLCQRSSDGKYLNSSGSWQTAAATAISITDASISGAGYVGFLNFVSPTVTLRSDDFATGPNAATTFTLAGPSQGPVAGSSNFTVTPDMPYTGTIIPSDGAAGGTFSPTSLTWSGALDAKTFTYTAPAAGAYTISATASPSLTTPASVSYTALGTPTESRQLTANFGADQTGLTVGYELLNPDDTVYTARTASGVAEVLAGTGSYGVVITVSSAFTGRVVWDTGGSSPLYAVDDTSTSATGGFTSSDRTALGVIETTTNKFVFDGSSNVKSAPQTDSPGTTTLLGRLTSTRAGNLDNLDVASSVLQTAINNLNNLSALANIYGENEVRIPDAGTTVWPYTLVVRDSEGHLADLAALPTLTLVDGNGTNLGSRLSAVTHAATGQYTFNLTATAGDPEAGLRLGASGTDATDSTARYATIGIAYLAVPSATTIQNIWQKVQNVPADPASESAVEAAITSAKNAIASDITTAVAPLETTTQSTANTNTITAAIADLGTPAQPGDAMSLTSDERTAIANALLDLVDAVETGVTLRESQRAFLSALASICSGAGTPTVTFRDVNNTKNRIVANVDADGNRSSVTLTLT